MPHASNRIFRRIFSASFAVLIVSSVIVISATSFVSPSYGAFPGENGKIAFDIFRDGNVDIHVMNPDGSSQTNLTDSHTSSEREPAWSPDGSKIAFAKNEFGVNRGVNNIYVMNPDGSNQTAVTNYPGPSSEVDDPEIPVSRTRDPAWSPDGTKIAYSGDSGEEFLTSNIYVVNLDGTGLTRITNVSDGVPISGPSYLRPAWSPDGSKIAALKVINFMGTLVTMNPDGSDITEIVKDFGRYYFDWSPDGSKIVYPADRNEISDIFTMNADGSGQETNITNNAVSSPGHPTWSPDGSKIAFTSILGIYVANADGSGHVKSLDAYGRNPAWGTSPPSPAENATLTVNSVNSAGNPITGLNVVVWSAADRSIKASGYTPLTFSTNTNGEYRVRILGYGDRTFDHWQDNPEGLAMPNLRPISLDNDTTLTAVFNTGDALRGFTSLTYAGTEEQPDLTVNATTLDGSKTLHMWAIIDPQSSDTNSTTYRVYATNGYQNLRFDHWEDGSTNRVRTLSIEEGVTITAYYKTG